MFDRLIEERFLSVGACLELSPFENVSGVAPISKVVGHFVAAFSKLFVVCGQFSETNKLAVGDGIFTTLGVEGVVVDVVVAVCRFIVHFGGDMSISDANCDVKEVNFCI